MPPSRTLEHPVHPHQTERLLSSVCAISASCVRHIMCSLLFYSSSSYYFDPPFPHSEAVLVLYWESNDNPHSVLKGQKYRELHKIIPVQCSMIHRSSSQQYCELAEQCCWETWQISQDILLCVMCFHGPR